MDAPRPTTESGLSLPAAAARRVLMLRAFETATPESPLWTAADAEWASRLAAAQLGPQAAPAEVLAERAQQAMQRLRPRSSAVARLVGDTGTGSGMAWVAGAALVALLAGLLADRLGSGQRIDLLAPGVWALVGWNLVVYLALAAQALRRGGAGRGAGAAGGLRRLVRRLWSARARTGIADNDAVLSSYAASWAESSLPAATARAALLLHVAAAALAAGLVAGLYLRGLVLDYRAGWQSTFLEPPFVQSLLALGLAPASALTGIALPGVEAVAALRLQPGAAATGAAAPWIHLHAATLALFVVVPRLALALAAALRAAWQWAHCPLPARDPYVLGLLRRHARRRATVQLVPHGQPAPAAATLALRRLLAAEFGDDLQLTLAPVVPYGEEETLAPPAADTTLRVLLFDLAATAEAEVQGRLVATCQQADAGAALLAVVDEAAYARRFAALPARVDERRQAWQQFADARGLACLFVDLERSDPAADAQALRRVLGDA